MQFGRYILGALRGDFGTSYSLGRPVSVLMGNAFGNTLILSALAALFAWVFGIVCGIIAAVKKNSFLDHLFMGMSLLGVSMPVFMVAMILQYVFGYHLHWLPISGASDIRGFILPVVTMMALQFSSLLSGAVITETVFSINGIGRLAVQAISGRDIPLLEGTALFATAVVILGNLIADMLYAVLDPRVGRREGLE